MTRQWSARRLSRMLPVLLLTSIGFWQAAGACSAQQPSAQQRGTLAAIENRPGFVDPGWLLRVEDTVLPPAIIPGPAAHDNLPAYYNAVNPQLFKRFAESRAAYESPQTRKSPFQRITYVAGDAGVGKTFLKGKVYSKECPRSEVYKFDIRELYQQWQAENLTESRADLHDGDLVINRLLSVQDQSVPLVARHLAAHPASFYVIDSLDEIHPDDHAWFFAQVEDFVFASRRDFVHLVVFGRPLAFREHWQRRQSGDERDIDLLVLHPPRFRTTGDLLISSWNYLGWRHQLRWSPSGGEPRGMMPDEFAAWADTGFSRFDKHASVVLDGDSAFTTRVHDVLRDWSRSHRVVGAPLYNLAGNSLLRAIVERQLHENPNPKYDERALMDHYLEAWLKRDSQSDDRPSLTKPEFLDLYIQLLELVAVKYLLDRQVDEYGFFAVQPSDQIQLQHGGRQLTFPVRKILDRSGMKHLDPRAPGAARYRFEPIWFHRLLVEMHNERTMARSFTTAGSGFRADGS